MSVAKRRYGRLQESRLAEAIRESGRTQREIADLLGVNPATISLYVSGRVEPPVSKALRLSVLVGRPVEELFGHLVFPSRRNRDRNRAWRGAGR